MRLIPMNLAMSERASERSEAREFWAIRYPRRTAHARPISWESGLNVLIASIL